MKQLSKNKLFFLLSIICVLTLLPFLGLNDFHTKGEPREAIVAVSMLESGNWILPTNNGGDIAYKPPFFHWSIAAVSLLDGEVTEYSSRLPSALALITMVLAVFLFFAKRRGTNVAFMTALLTLSAFEVHRAGMNCRVDMVLTAFIVFALIQLYRWTERGCKGFPYYATIFMGIATLTKGPVGIILPCLVTGVYLLVRGVKFNKAFFSLIGIGLVSFILPAIWYVIAYQQGGDNFITLVLEENFGRFMGTMSYESHENPPSYYVVAMLAGLVPWTLLVLFSLFGLNYARPKGKWGDWWKQLTAYIKGMDSARLYSLLTIVLIFVFYCIPKSKRSVYLLPIFPFVAYFLAEYMIYLTKRVPKSIKAFGLFFSSLFVLILLVLGAVELDLIPASLFSGKHAVENSAYVMAIKSLPINFWNILWVFLPILPIVYFFQQIKRKTMDSKVVYAIIGLVFAVTLSLDAVYQPAILNTKSDKPFAYQVAQIVPEGKIYSYIPFDPMMRFFVINFYNDNRVVLFEQEMPEEGYMLIGEKAFADFEQKYGHEYSCIELLKGNKRGNDVREIICLYSFKKHS